MKQPKNIPPAPENLTKEEGKIFTEIAKKLHDCELLSSLDIYSLECYSVQLALFRKAKKELEKSGQYIAPYTNKAGASNLVASPWLLVLKNSGDALIKLSAKLALSPADRNKASKVEKKTVNQGNLLK